MNIKSGMYYRTRDGRKAYCLGVNPLNKEQFAIALDFMCYSVTADGEDDAGDTEYDLIAEWREPRTWTGEVALYDLPGGGLAVLPLRSLGIYAGASWNCIARKTVTITEGEGMENPQ